MGALMEGNELFDRTLHEKDQAFNMELEMQGQEDDGEEQPSSQDLEQLKLGLLQDKILDHNPVFVQLRGKLVNFY